MADFTPIALAVKPVDVATPLMQAARIRQAQVEEQTQRDNQVKQAAGDWARGVAVYAGKPEFAQKWAEGLDDLHNRGMMPTQAYQSIRNTPSPLMLQQIIAQTTDPRLAFQMEESKRAQSNADRQFAESQRVSNRTAGFEERRLKLAEDSSVDKPEIVWKKDANDVERPYIQNARKGTVTPLDGAGDSSAPGNPFSVGGGMKEHEGKSALFADRAATAQETLNKFEKINSDVPGFVGGMAEKVPYIGEMGMNIVGSSERGQFMNAKRAFVNALLRRESGAAINASEFESYDKEYFPQPGDGPAQIDAKRKHRAEVIAGLAREAGKNYRPRFSLDVDTGQISKSGQKQTASKSGGVVKWELGPDGNPRPVQQ